MGPLPPIQVAKFTCSKLNEMWLYPLRDMFSNRCRVVINELVDDIAFERKVFDIVKILNDLEQCEWEYTTTYKGNNNNNNNNRNNDDNSNNNNDDNSNNASALGEDKAYIEFLVGDEEIRKYEVERNLGKYIWSDSVQHFDKYNRMTIPRSSNNTTHFNNNNNNNNNSNNDKDKDKKPHYLTHYLGETNPQLGNYVSHFELIDGSKERLKEKEEEEEREMEEKNDERKNNMERSYDGYGRLKIFGVSPLEIDLIMLFDRQFIWTLRDVANLFEEYDISLEEDRTGKNSRTKNSRALASEFL